MSLPILFKMAFALLLSATSSFVFFLQKNKCMRIKILGDCYYCVAGAPTPDPDHAKNSIAMGLSMIDLIHNVRLVPTMKPVAKIALE